MKIQLSTVFYIILLSSCGKGICLQGTGAITKQARPLSAFTEIALHNRINLIITQDSSESIEVEAGNHLLDGIETSVEKNVLTIADNNGCNWARDMDARINVYIHTARLKTINYHGTGNISSTNTLLIDTFLVDSWDGVGSINLTLNSRQCQVHVRDNNADITISGETDLCIVYCAAQGKVDLRNFVSQHVLIDHRSIYDSYIYCQQSISGDLRYKGNLYYKGTPSSKNVQIHNTGQLLPVP